MDPLGCSSTGTEASQPAPVCVDDPEARAPAPPHTSAEDDLAVMGSPAHA
jgi:hypothetical protein